MINLEQFIADHVINRQKSMFAEDIEANKETLQKEIENKSICVVGGAGSIGSPLLKQYYSSDLPNWLLLI